VLALTGLGHVWIENGRVERMARIFARRFVGRTLRGPGTHYLFENHDDPAEFGLESGSPDVTIVGGAGVRLADFPVVPAPAAPPVKVAVVGRMLVSKGIVESIAAISRARASGAAVELHLFGAPDPSNRRSLSEAQLRGWSAEPGIYWHGPSADVAGIWREHHIAMLLSYREGLPKSLVEAAASGRPIIATDVVGCREVVRDGVEGLLVPPGSVEAAASALVRLTEDPQLRARLGAAANARFRERFTEDQVMLTIGRLYRSVLERP